MSLQSHFAAGRGSATVLAALVFGASAAPQAQRPLFAPAPGSPITVAGAPGNIALGDVNGDGKLDLVVVSGSGVTVLLGNGDGQFRVAPASPLTMDNRPTEMVLRDFTQDGQLDLALASHGSYAVVIHAGTGKGTFDSAPASTVLMKDGQAPHTHGLMAGDLNSDGRLDLVTVNSEDNDISIAFGDDTGGFRRAPSSFAVGGAPYPGALGDLDGDGHLDIVATSTDRRTPGREAATRALTVLFGDGHGAFLTRTVPLRTVLPWFVAVGHVNGDRAPDLVVTHAERRELTILLGEGNGGFTEAPRSPFDLGASAWHVAVVDLNGDGKADVAAAAGNGVRVMLGDGLGGFVAAPGSPFGAGKGTWQLAIGDVNGDGKPDVAATNLESDSVTVLLAQ